MSYACSRFCTRKSILKGKTTKIPKRITMTDHFTDLIQHGIVSPDSAAIIGEDGEVLFTPMQLDLTANKIAKALRKYLGYWTSNNPDGDLVIAFCLHTTECAVLMKLAIMKLGATYLCLSTTYPEQQIVRILGITRPLMIVTETEPKILSRFDCVRHICEIFTYYEILEGAEIYSDDPNDPVPLESLAPPWRRAACIVFTAGTTGEPHGVRINHMSLLNRLYWQFKAIPYQQQEKACLSSLLVDAESVAEIFAPLLGNASLYIVPRHIMGNSELLLNKIQQLRLTRITLTPTGLTSILNAMDQIGVAHARSMVTSIRYWVVSGDILPFELGLKFFDYLNPSQKDDSCVLVYFYGATEIMSEATWEIYTDVEDFKEKSHGKQVSIGQPLSNIIVFIMDEDMLVVPEGTIGEICISGISVAMGYSDNRDNNARFVHYPPNSKKNKGTTIFMTGDYGKIMEGDGCKGSRLYYEGRTDMIMKIQGKEIELKDIAEAVNNTGMCNECEVLCYHRNREDQAAVAFCVMQADKETPELADALKLVLDELMVPEVYPVTELPYLPSGRLDRQKLLKMYKFRRMESTPEEWKALNLQLAEKQATKVLFEAISHTIGVTLRFVMANYQSSYWSIGGNSLNALIIVQTCRENGYLISIDDFVMSETLSDLTQVMIQSSRSPCSDAQMVMHICDLAEWKYSLNSLEQHHKNDAISLLAECHCEKDVLSKLLGATKEDLIEFVDTMWSEVVKENLSLVACEKESGKIVGVVLNTDVNSRNLRKVLKHVRKPNSYWIEAFNACELILRRTTINKDKGKVIQIFMLGTDISVESKFNVILIEYLIKGSMERALFRGFSWALIMGASPLIRDLCGKILQYDLLAELKLNSFVCKDKTKPFRHGGDFVAIRAYYRLFV